MSFPEAFFRWRPHPWHGLEPGQDAPHTVQAYIEITPFDLIKYEVDKVTGYMRVDRPNRSSSQPPSLYGFIPRTYCGPRVAALCPKAEQGDGDPLDICVISERPITRAEVLLHARVVGGIQMIDRGDADDKIIAVLANDNIWAKADDIDDVPSAIVERLRHYFGTYKLVPGEDLNTEVTQVYGRDQAHRVVEAALADYEQEYGS